MTSNPTYKTYQLLHQVVSICHQQGVQHVVLCPGSRSAPIALIFMRFDGIKHYVIPDERSAAYTALGIARQSKRPVAIICTSGTAALNFSPAVAEAYFSEIPLIVFTADRPVEWLGQADNQAIYQQNLYGRHVKASFTLPTEINHPDTEWYALRVANEALNTARLQPKGPVHLNVPLREPLYMEDEYDFSDIIPKKIELVQSEKTLSSEVLAMLSQFRKIMIVSGTHRVNKALCETISTLCSQKKIVFVPDITSGFINLPGSVSFSELIIDGLTADEKKEFLPELIISFGGPIVSKTLKQFLRHKDIKAHWHLSGHPASADTFQQLTHIFDIDTKGFLKAALIGDTFKSAPGYYDKWAAKEKLNRQSSESILKRLSFSEIRAVYEILSGFPENAVLHLGNSLPVRFATVFPFIKEGTEIYSNRGTSGIDGTVSSAVGQSMVDGRMHVLICGDLAFMYDSNGLWNNYLQANLKIIVFNNHGGGIFRTLPGAKAQKELEEYFVVKQQLSFEHTALQHNCHYFYANDLEGLKAKLADFYAANEKPAVFEIEFGENITIGEVKGMIKNTQAAQM